jgi:hypothetical protein
MLMPQDIPAEIWRLIEGAGLPRDCTHVVITLAVNEPIKVEATFNLRRPDGQLVLDGERFAQATKRFRVVEPTEEADVDGR